MSNESSSPKLELIRSPKREPIQPDDFLTPDYQSTLFAQPRPGLLILVYFPEVTEEEFRATLAHAKPAQVLELRSAPRFDIGRLNRQSAFQLFAEEDAKYVDVTALYAASPGRPFSGLESFLKMSHVSADRPLMILLNKAESGNDLGALRTVITNSVPQVTELFEVPHFSQTHRAAAVGQ